MITYNKQHLFPQTFNMPQKTISSWNKYKTDNYRLFTIVALENITFIYSFKTNLARHDSKFLSNKNKMDIFITNFIDAYLKVLQKNDLKIFNKPLDSDDKKLILKSIEDVLTDSVVEKLDIWKYYNKTICRRNINRRKNYLIALMFVLLILVNE